MLKMSHYEAFWKLMEGKQTPTQLQRYIANGSPEYIQKFIAIGGGSRMGTTMEEFGRHTFKSLRDREKGRGQTGYDHRIFVVENRTIKTVFVEQKSSGYWNGNDFKWQHIESKHKWTMLLLCGITYTEVKFWAMDRPTFQELIAAKKITNQGDKDGNSSEGMWMYYSDIKESLVEINTDEELVAFATHL
jgi:hypothetical protein